MEEWLEQDTEDMEVHVWNRINAAALGYARAYRDLAQQIRTLNAHLYPTNEEKVRDEAGL
jgi:O6-methylguanine-DNA--protein-cysteine methyltransferase